MEDIFGYLASILIGFTLGLIGGGGSILTLPVLTYLFYLDAVTATSYSLFVVGATALIGAVQYFRRGQVDIRTGVIFAIPALISVYLTRRYLMPAIPESLLTIGGYELTRDMAILIWFAVIMLFAGISMIRKRRTPSGGAAEAQEGASLPLHWIALEGLLVGVLTGVVGAGGGFLIIPALVLLAKLPMKTAVGTSLMIISAKSLIGFGGDVMAGLPIDMGFLLLITGLAILGLFAGIVASHYIAGQRLKTGFGWFVLVMAAYILLREVLL